MTALNFAPSVAIVRDFEGGFVNSPKDPGGATKFGITEFALSSHRGHAASPTSMRCSGRRPRRSTDRPTGLPSTVTR